MTDERAPAGMVVVGFGAAGTSPPAELVELIRRGVGGVILFSRNFESVRQLAELCGAIKRAAGDRAILICIDHEGGRVMRARQGFTPIPSMREVGARDDVQYARDVARVMATELRAVNIDFNFSPVLDVDTNPANPVIADRSFGREPALVSRLGVAMIESMQSHGVAACGKHFPGHGDTSLDSHLALPALSHDMDRLRAVELPPFRAAVRAGVASIMTAHVVFEALDPGTPATMSRRVLTGLLREELRFDGVIVSDCLQMKAIADHFGVERAAVEGANAGVDLFLVCHDHDVQHRAIDALAKAARSGDLPAEQLSRASERIDRLKNRFARPPVDADRVRVVGCDAHRAVVGDALTPAGSDPTSRVPSRA